VAQPDAHLEGKVSCITCTGDCSGVGNGRSRRRRGPAAGIGEGEGVRVLETHQITYMRMSMAVMMGVIQWRIDVQYWHPG